MYFASGRTMKREPSPAPDSVAWAWRRARRVVVSVVGGSIVLLGLALLFLPGPACVVIPAGLAVLATEFVWARRLLRKVRHQGEHWGGKLLNKVKRSPEGAGPDEPRIK